MRQPLFFLLHYLCVMKKWLLIGLTFLFSLSGFSQIVDTLGIIEYRNGTPTLYTSPNGGFAFGNNGYNDRVKAQTFQVENPVTLTEVLIEFGAVIYSSANPESVVNVNIYDNYGSGILVQKLPKIQLHQIAFLQA